MIAGPSEIELSSRMIVNPVHLAADLLSQAEPMIHELVPFGTNGEKLANSVI